MLLSATTATIAAQRGGNAASSSAATNSGKPGAVESKSAIFAGELAKLLTSQNLESIAIATPDADAYVGALLAPGQLLVIRAKYPAKDRMSYLLLNKMYKDAYLDLNSASEVASRMFISDLGADGLQFRNAKDQPFDMVNIAGKSMSFDGKWGGKENPSKDDYAKAYETSDEQYTQMLQVLISALKKSS